MPCHQPSSSSSEQQQQQLEAMYSLLQFRRSVWNDNSNRTVLDFPPLSPMEDARPVQWSPLRARLPTSPTTHTRTHHHRAAYLISVLDEALDICNNLDVEENVTSRPSDDDRSTNE